MPTARCAVRGVRRVPESASRPAAGHSRREGLLPPSQRPARSRRGASASRATWRDAQGRSGGGGRVCGREEALLLTPEGNSPRRPFRAGPECCARLPARLLGVEDGRAPEEPQAVRAGSRQCGEPVSTELLDDEGGGDRLRAASQWRDRQRRRVCGRIHDREERAGGGGRGTRDSPMIEVVPVALPETVYASGTASSFSWSCPASSTGTENATR